MKKELATKMIFQDFVLKTTLTENEMDILKRYIRNDSIAKIAIDTLQSERTVSRIVADLKQKYNNYKKIELVKLNLLISK